MCRALPLDIQYMLFSSLLHRAWFVMVASTAGGGGVTSSSLLMSSNGTREHVSNEVQAATTTQPQPPFTTQISIWLMPPDPQRRQLQEYIDTLARIHGGPTFTPHVTIIGKVLTSSAAAGATEQEEQRIVETLRQTLHSRPSVECAFRPGLVSFRDRWNQALVALLDPSKDDEFVRLCCEVREALDMPTADWSFPPPAQAAHMSLFYGVGDNVPRLSEDDGNVKGHPMSMASLGTFRAHQVHVVRVVANLESVTEWKCVGSIDFQA